ncbi:Pvc16 family protein [Aureibacter tunicatorum]|uniref:Pvc16 N-terminal domain-containing protein n=1 Tax=Aureibacter tunicatorum TaxID=866807 RepID=A0AAE4BQD8_9BACT|nr:Pvc16 family protein [Aureibacter tunicatorum]MDR6237431.1 hypothetical protein [Aureibacter tunicatorum]BDD06421.1 hypothetical protein AUTU_39040 [Aureibacter tunicatorum]
MLRQVLEFTQGEINDYLNNRFGLTEDAVICSSIVDRKGEPVLESDENKIVANIVHLEQEFTAPSSTVNMRQALVRKLNFNVYIMFSACYEGTENYLESVEHLSGVLEFFQANPVFSHQTHPNLDKVLHKVSFEYHNIDFLKLSNIWGLNGGKYYPSLLFKVRTVSFAADEIVPVSKIGGMASNLLES